MPLVGFEVQSTKPMTIHQVLSMRFALLDADRVVPHVPLAPTFFGRVPLPAWIGHAWDVRRADTDLLTDQVLLLGVVAPPGFKVVGRFLADTVPAIPKDGVIAVEGNRFDVSSAFSANDGPLFDGHIRHALSPLLPVPRGPMISSMGSLPTVSSVA